MMSSLHILLVFPITLLAEETVQKAGFQFVPLVDNFRSPQPLGERLVYRSSKASAMCHNLQSNVQAEREWGRTTRDHWSYSDQERWFVFVPEDGVDNNCRAAGQSPIDVNVPSTVALGSLDSAVTLSEGFKTVRRGLTLENSGYSIELKVCQQGVDCTATASFGTWPQELHKLSKQDYNLGGDFFLSHLTLHWGKYRERGSEHLLCGHSAAGELQMFFKSKQTDVRTTTVVISTFLESGASQDNSAWTALFDVLPEIRFPSQRKQLQVGINLASLMPADLSKWFSYAGSSTTPPCSQPVTWIILENSVSLSDRQLSSLRQLLGVTQEKGETSYAAQGILFPFTAFAMGVVTNHILNRYADFVPYTVVMLIEGILVDWFASLDFHQEVNSVAQLNQMQISLDIWAHIDGHLLLLVFLPGLLFSDSISLSTYLLKKTFWQSLFLAGPGVVFGAVFQGIVSYYILPYGWSWYLSFAFGSILSATDPVAVVANLKSCGASETLTMIITGESMLNDGTAMVLFMLFWNLHKGWATYDFGGLVSFFLQMAVAAPLFGVACGLVAFLLMSKASRRYSHDDIINQTVMTLVTAYLCYYAADQLLGMSGVLAVIFCGFTLSMFVWPIVSSRKSLDSVWHFIEFLGNTLLFCLAGVIIHRAIADTRISGADFGWCLVTYVFMQLIRACLIALCHPVMRRIGAEIDLRDSAFMAWAGLRGGCAVALALFVRESLADEDPAAGSKIMFHVAVSTLLTIVLNGSLSGPFLKFFDMVGISQVKTEMLNEAQKKLKRDMYNMFLELCERYDVNAEDVNELVDTLSLNDSCLSFGVDFPEFVPVFPRQIPPMQVLSEITLKLPEYHDSVESLKAELATLPPPNDQKVETIRGCFLTILQAKYWQQIRAGKLPKRSKAARTLLHSIEHSLHYTSRPLFDWDIVDPLNLRNVGLFDKLSTLMLDIASRWFPEEYTINIWVDQEIESFLLRHCFVDAHCEAQQTLREMFIHELGSPGDYLTVILESLEEILQDEAEEKSISPDLVRIIEKNIIGKALIEEAINRIESLIKQGVFSPDEAHRLIHEVKRDKKALFAMNKSNMKEMKQVYKRSPSSPTNRSRRPSLELEPSKPVLSGRLSCLEGIFGRGIV